MEKKAGSRQLIPSAIFVRAGWENFHPALFSFPFSFQNSRECRDTGQSL